MKKKILFEKVNKQLISTMPVVTFDGKIIVIQTKEDVKMAVDFLSKQPLVGIDTETRPSFRKGVSHKVALMQVSTRNICCLFRLNMTGITNDLEKLLESEAVLKVGLSLHDDIRMLHERSDCNMNNYIELQDFVKQFSIQDRSLQKLFANVFQQKISKSQQLTNWEADVLTEKQKKYASTDAWACVMLYEELLSIKKNGNYEVIAEQKLENTIYNNQNEPLAL